jgi:tetratricopeptide (TPR) repeat protein
MYKTKITQWGLKKNYTAAEKEHLARVFKEHRDSGKGIPPLTLGNRPAKLDRIRRFCKQEKILDEICDALKSDWHSKGGVNLSAKAPSGDHGAVTAQVICAAVNSVQNSSLSSVQGLTQTLLDPERPFSTTSDIGRIELILLQTKIYYQSRLGSGTRSDTRDAPTRDYQESVNLVYRWIGKLKYGMGALGTRKHAQGWRMINEACEMVHKFLEQQPRNLLTALFYGLSEDALNFFPGLRTSLLRFFTKSSVGKLGCNHPISVVLYHWQEQQIFADAVSPAFEVLLDVSGENLNLENDELWEIRSYYCGSLKGQGEYAAAESHGLRFLKQAEEVFGRLHWRTRELLFEFTLVKYYQGHYDLAEIGYQDIVQRGREDLGNEVFNASCIYGLHQLALISEVRGDFAQSEEYWRAALTGAINGWGMEDDETTYITIRMEESFKNQGMDPEAWLQQNFGISCT